MSRPDSVQEYRQASYAMPRRKLAALVSAAVLVANAAAAAEPTLPPDLARAAADYDRAQVENDKVALERLVADDYVLVNSGAQVENKAQFVAESTAPGFKLKPFHIDDPVVRVWTDGAVLGGAVSLDGVSDNVPFKGRLRFADVWRRRDGRWQVIFTEITRVPAR